jgi:hypothetical protein
MGCSSSKPEDPKQARKIKFKFGKLNVPKFDQFFDSASKLLENAEGIREGVQDSKEEGQELSDTFRLKNYQYAETVRVLFWSLSASAKGNIKSTKITCSTEAPFVVLDYFPGLNADTQTLCKTFEKFLKAVTTGPTTLVDIVKGLEDLVNKGKDFPKNAKADFKAAGLNPMDSVKALGTLTKNLNILTKELPKVKNITPLVAEAAKDMKVLAPKFKDIFFTCDTIGGKAFAAGHLTPKAIFTNYHTEPRKTDKEIADEKAAADPKNKKKGGKGKPDPKKGGADPKKTDTNTKPASTNPAPTTNNTNQAPNNNPSGTQQTNNPTNPNTQGTNQQTNNPTNPNAQGTNQNTNVPYNLSNQQGQQNNQQTNNSQSSGNPNQNIINNNPNNSTNPNTQNPQNFGGPNPSSFGGNAPNNNANIHGSKGGSDFGGNLPNNNNPSAFNNPSTFNNPLKMKSQDEDAIDDEDNRGGPIIGRIHESHQMHQSNLKREKFIKTNI